MKFGILTPFYCWDPDVWGGEEKAGIRAGLLAPGVNALSWNKKLLVQRELGSLWQKQSRSGKPYKEKNYCQQQFLGL